MAEPGDRSETPDIDDERLPFTEHLRELRTRTIRAVVAVVLAFGVSWLFHERLFEWLMSPYADSVSSAMPDAPEYLAFKSLLEPFVVYLKTSLSLGVIVAMPYVLFEAWLFVAPGLYKHERQLALPFIVLTCFFFGGGVLFARYVVLEPAITVLMGFAGAAASPAIMMQEYFAFTTRMLLVFGLLFELPVAIAFLSALGLVTHVGLIRNWRYAVVISFVVGAMLTPPDPLTQTALAVPLSLLYILSIGISYLITKRREERTSEAT